MKSRAALEEVVREAYVPEACLEAYHNDFAANVHLEAANLDTDADTESVADLEDSKAAVTLEGASPSFSFLSRWTPQGPSPTDNLYHSAQFW